MEGDTGDGREAPVQKKGKEFYANTDREIDQHELAELLRKSADIVERGEFGSVLYEALQDFRVYYKQKYPKSAKKKKVKKEKEKPERGSHSTPIDLTEEKSAAASTEILDDLKKSEEKVSKEAVDADSKETKANGTNASEENEKKPDPDGRNDDAVDQSEPSGEASSKPEAADNADDAAVATAAAAIGLSARSNASEGKIDDSSPPLVSEDTLPAVADDAENTADPSELSPTPSSSASVPLDSAMPIPEYPSNGEGPNGIFKNNQKNKVGFGKKFKLGSTFENVKKAAKNAKKNIKENIHLDKRTSTKARDELEYFAETGMGMAESSGRRTQAYEGKGFQSRVTAGMAGASVAGSSENEQTNEFVSNDSSTDHHGRTDFGQSGNRVNPALFESPRFAQPPVSNNASEKGRFGFSPRHQPAGYSFSEQEGSEDGDFNHPELNHAAVGIKQTASEASAEEADSKMDSEAARPKFQRPDNQGSQLVVSGWIEQFRRSKMRLVWKEVLASLVEGRKPGEVTTLWIQREIVDPLTGQKELEALHRIPLQILEDVSLTEQTSDSQFRLKLHNHTEEFVFRCDGAPNDSLRWVQILKQYAKLTKEKMRNENTQAPPESNPFHQQAQVPSTKGMPIRDLRAICHGAGINTTGMERSQLEAAAEDVQRRGTYFDQRGAPTGPSTQQYPPQQQHQANPVPTDTSIPPQQAPPPAPQRMSIKELRAICHGAGIKTVGMERRDLEAAAQEVQNRGTYFPPTRTQEDDETRARREELRRQNQQKEEMQRRKEAEERHRREVEASRARAFAEQEARRRAAEEEARRRAFEEEQRRRAAAEEARRRAAAEEQIRRQREAHEAQQRYAQQQAAWQQQHHAEEQRRRAAEQKAAAEHRQREEARRKEQQWSTPAPGAHPQHQAHQYHHQPQQQHHQGYPQQQWQQQQYQQPHQQQHHPPPPQQPHQARAAPPPPQQQQRQHSGKYAKMASQSEDDDGQAAITKIKHSILIQWALQPPQLQVLRPIAALVTTIHTVFPPALGVKGHEYFKKWKPITREDLAGANGLPDEAKLKKSVRKIRFFLHPDKLPHDLDEEQKFTVKMLWDITNDSWEEYQKHKEDLDWVN